MISFSHIHPKLKEGQYVLMDHCVTGVAELTTAPVAQLNFLRAPLYILPSLLHLGIGYIVSQGPNSENRGLGDLVHLGGIEGGTSPPLI